MPIGLPPPVRRRRAGLAASVGCALLALVPMAAPAAAARPGPMPRDWLGVVVDGPMTEGTRRVPNPSAEWDRIAASGARSVRVSFYWSAAQPTGPERVDFAASDALVLAAARRGLDVIPTVLGAPAWAAAVPGDFGSPPSRLDAYGAYLEALVARYGPRGSLWQEHRDLRARPIRTWQIWNEPNITFFWSLQPFADGYARLLAVARDALRRADPGATLVLAGMPNRSWEALDTIYRAGARDLFDAVALHPYTARPRDVIRLLALARAVMRRHGDGAKPLWVTELSWSAAAGKAQIRIGIETTPRGQALRLRRGLRLLAAARRRLRIPRVYWYTWVSHEGRRLGGMTDTFGWAGLRRVRGRRVVSTPALRAFRRTARELRRGRRVPARSTAARP